MCGIAGIISFDERFAPDEALLRKMSACIAHRGPDGEGILMVSGPGTTQAGLAHRRLAILDPDPRSNQPFTTEYTGRKLHLVFNGEIYNFRELRPRLEKELPNFPWRTTGDTEVLLAAYFAWGERCVEEFLGMFAFAIFDETNGSVFLARDRMGQKPLYYSTAPDLAALAFSSEINGLTSIPWVDTTLSERSLQHYMALGYTSFSETIYHGISKLPRSNYLTMGAEPIHSQGFGRTEVRQPSVPTPERTRSVVGEAVTSQLVSDVPVGCFLSGGVDSSIISLCASRALSMMGQKLHTFTIKFPDPRYDESVHAAEVARHLRSEHHEFSITPDAASDLPLLARHFGEPFADSSLLPTYYLSRETRKHVKVALSGDGGDELFAGYDRYRALVLSEKYRRLLKLLPENPPSSWAGSHPKGWRARAARIWSSARLPTLMRYESYVRLFPPGMFGAGAMRAMVPMLASDPRFGRGERTLLEWAIQFDQFGYLPDDLLTKVDRASMAVALEVRSPFMDHRLVQYANAIQAEHHLSHGPKTLLRRAFAKDLPLSVFKRRKMGFAVPIGEWFRKDLRPMVHDLLLSPNSFTTTRFGQSEVRKLIEDHESARTDHSQRIFALVMLELWAQSRPSP